MSLLQKIRTYWRLVLLLPVGACVVCVVDLARAPTYGDFLFASLAVVFFGVHLFRFAIGGRLVLAEESKTPLRMKEPAPLSTEQRKMEIEKAWVDDGVSADKEEAARAAPMREIQIAGNAPLCDPGSPYLRARGQGGV